MKDDQVTKDLAMIARNAIDYINKLEHQINELKRTAPPQRKPLTEEEILSLFRTAGSPVLFARAIEDKHGIV